MSEMLNLPDPSSQLPGKRPRYTGLVFYCINVVVICFNSLRGNPATASSKGKKKETFYSESSSEDDSDVKDESGSSDSKSDSSSEIDSDSADSDSEESSGQDHDDSVNISQQNVVRLSPSLSPSPPAQRLSRTLVIQSSSESEYSSNSSDSDSNDSDKVVKTSRIPPSVPKSNLDLLLDLDGKSF